MKIALAVVRGLHGSRTEGTIRRFKVGDFETEFNGLGVLRTDIRIVPGRRRGDRIGERMSASVKVCGRRPHDGGAADTWGRRTQTSKGGNRGMV